MLKSKTVLILGAGASMDYGYPSGPTLLKLIRAECLRVQNGDYNRFANTGRIDVKQFSALRKLIDTVNYESIDSLLEANPQHVELGKMMIALCLLPHEDPEAAFDMERRSQNWMHYLFKKMLGQNFQQFLVNELTIVTFNYDRCYDHFFQRQIKDWFHESDRNVTEAMKAMPIIHVHGVLSSVSQLPYGSYKTHVGVITRLNPATLGRDLTVQNQPL